MSKVLIIVLSYNGAKVLGECLGSLKPVKADVLVVDNHSTDNTAEIAATYHCKVLSLDSNMGYAGGNNRGIEYALASGYEYVLLLNDDTVVSPHFLDELLKPMDDPMIGFVAPKVYYYDEPNKLSWCGSTVDMWRGHGQSIGDGEEDRGQYDTPRITEFANGCCILIKCSVLRTVGLLDERFFIYWEEADLCKRGALTGSLSYYQPSSWIWHHISATGGNQYLFARNRWWYMAKYASLSQFLVFGLYNIFIETPRLLLHFSIRGEYGRAVKVVKGTFRGLVG